jgi:hypothetical protein
LNFSGTAIVTRDSENTSLFVTETSGTEAERCVEAGLR